MVSHDNGTFSPDGSHWLHMHMHMTAPMVAEIAAEQGLRSRMDLLHSNLCPLLSSFPSSHPLRYCS